MISAALGQTDRATIDQRLTKRVEFAAKLSIEEGDTLFLERRELVPSKRITKKLGDYEGIVTGITAPKGIVVHARIDEIKLEPLGDKTAVIFRYAIHSDPQSTGGGKVALTLNLVERTGLANTVVSAKLQTEMKIVPFKATVGELTADFWGYRTYRKLAEEKMAGLERKNLRGLSLADQARLPTIDRVTTDVALEVFEFERARRRVWIAHRRLTAARGSSDTKISSAGKVFFDNLERPSDQLTGLPGAEQKQEEPVTTLKPDRVEPVGQSGQGTSGGGTTLAPVTSYEPGTEGDDPDISEPAQPDPRTEPGQAKAPDKPVEVATADPNQPPPDPTIGPGGKKEDDFLDGRPRRREIPIPTYPRGLVLDDVNIAHAGGVRYSHASVNVGGTSATAPAIFYYAQAGVTRAFGIELTVPTVLIDLDVPRARTRYLMGNPLLAAKYRFHLPTIEGRQPALTVRARWGIPISPLNTIPPTTRGAEAFSRPAHFDDPYAFTLEKNDFGLGISAAYQIGMIFTGVQMYGDYFVPVSDSQDTQRFPTFSWGATVGVMPVGELLQIHLEGRSTTLISGPGRTDFFTYLGVRSRFIEHGEAAVWGALPIGPVNRVSGFQLGIDVRYTYDIQDAIILGTGAGDRGILE